MSKEKQIEEMAEDLAGRDSCKHLPKDLCNNRKCSLCEAEILYEAGYRKIPDNIGEFSDGYHTFNELYHHRAVLFSVICNMFPEKSWKSKLHDTGDMFDGMFIVGIETEYGQATYHYDIEPYWDMFKIKELEKAPKWDGHTSSDAIERIGNMSVKGYRKQSGWINVEERLPQQRERVLCYSPERKSKSIFVGYIGSYSGFWLEEPCYCCISEVTHWMPLPEAPHMRKEDEGK